MVYYTLNPPGDSISGPTPTRKGGSSLYGGKGRTLSYDDVTHYGKIVVALRETMRLMEEIDEAIPSWPIE